MIQRDSTSVVHACLVRYFCIAFMHMKFDIAFCIFIVMSLLKLSWLFSVPPRYFTSDDICIVWLQVVNGFFGIFQSWALEPKVMYSVLSVFGLNLIMSIQDFITARVCPSFLCALSCFARSEAGKDFLREWSSANPFKVMSADTILSIRAL